jgi:3-oxoacyl-[acyl-carrier protein] reductase
VRLKDKVAIITGGAEGIGRAYAEGFVKEGARVVIADINYHAARALADNLTKQGYGALATRTDVSIVADTQDMVQKTLDKFGRIDILINNAAVFQRVIAVRSKCWEMDPADFEKVIKVNVTGVFLCCKAVVPYMIQQKSGKIINIASSLAFQGAANLTHYAASKGAVVTFTRSLAREVGEYNINVNSLCPGFTLSADPSTITDERRQTEIPSRILKRPEIPEDLVGTAIYLASSDSDFMTGEAIIVDGGAALH